MKYQRQDHFKFIIKEYEMATDNLSIRIYGNKIENMVEAMKLLGSMKSKITENRTGENVPHLEITEVVFVQCDIVSNDYQEDSRVYFFS